MSNPNIPVAVCVCPNYGKKTFDDADGPFISTSREAMPLLLEVARLAPRLPPQKAEQGRKWVI
jgi:hypothetical protein